MIRLKHRQYPVWITWEGDPSTFEKVKTFLINRIIEVNELNLISSSNKEKINSIEVKFKYKNENFSNKLDKDNTFFKDGLCIYTFRDFNVALEFFILCISSQRLLYCCIKSLSQLS